jgi:methionine-rich copper-binding protein CopC
MKRFVTAFFVIIMALVALTDTAAAHAKLDHCQPAVGSANATAPNEVRCWFTEELDDKQSTLSVTDANNQRVDNNDGKVDLNDKEHKQVFATLKTLPQGVYKVSWKVITPDDNGTTNGEWYFGIGTVTVPQSSTSNVQEGTPGATPSPTQASATPSIAPSPAPTTSSPNANTVPDAGRTFVFAGLVIAGAAGIALVAQRVIR